MIRVYVAGPIDGDGSCTRRENASKGIEVAHQLLMDGFTPFCPHLNVFWEEQLSVPQNVWLAFDLEWLRQCQALLRMPGFSSGADAEVQFAIRNGIPVFYNIDSLLMWRAHKR